MDVQLERVRSPSPDIDVEKPQSHQRAGAECARNTPSRPPAVDSSSDSVSTCRTSRTQSAPSATRVAISRRREAPPPPIMPATFVQVSSRSNATIAVHRQQRRGEVVAQSSEPRPSRLHVDARLPPHRVRARQWRAPRPCYQSSTRISARACSMDTPGFSRAISPSGKSPVALRLGRWIRVSMAAGTQTSGVKKPTRSPKTPRGGNADHTVPARHFSAMYLPSRRIAIEARLPMGPAQDRHRQLTATHLIVLRTNEPPDRGLHAERREERPNEHPRPPPPRSRGRRR